MADPAWFEKTYLQWCAAVRRQRRAGTSIVLLPTPPPGARKHPRGLV